MAIHQGVTPKVLQVINRVAVAYQAMAGGPYLARRVEIDCDRPQPVERDGDPLDTPRDHLVIEVVPGALTLCVPPGKGSEP